MSWQYVPQVRWTNPVGDGAVIDVFTYGGHPLIVEWAGGNGTAPAFDVEFALAKFDASASSYSLLYSTTVTNPAPGSANPPFPQAFVPLSVRGLRMDAGDELVYSIRIVGDGPDGLNWANLYDHPFYIKFVGVVPEPSTYAMFVAGIGLCGFVGYRRKSVALGMSGASA